MRFTHSAAALAIAVLSAPVAQATSLASASITGLTFTLIDLAPEDGVESSFSFVSTTGSTKFSISAKDANWVGVENRSFSRVGTFSFTREQSMSLTNSYIEGTIRSDELSLSGEAYGVNTSYAGALSTGVSPADAKYYASPRNLLLSANSLLLIEAHYDLTAVASDPLPCSEMIHSALTAPVCRSTPEYEKASATVSSFLSYTYSGSPTTSTYSSSESRSLQASASGSFTGTSYQHAYLGKGGGTIDYDPIHVSVPDTEQFKQESGILRSVFSNSTGLTQEAYFYLSAEVAGRTAVVPEPSTYALMLLGLGGIGLVASRQRRQA